MDRIVLQAMRDALRSRLSDLDAVTVGCPSCQRFAAGRCKLANEVPPADVQKAGCDEWLFDEIPF